MKAAVLVAPSKCEVRDLPLPEINDNEVLIKVKACGVCASELESWHKGSGGRNGVMGHEPVGIIEKMGRNVTGFSAGDRITGLIHGGFSEYTKADYRDCVKVPEKLDDFEALGEPLSCLVSGAERTTVHLGDTVAVNGLGFMGLGFIQLMKLKGAGKIVAIDVRQDSLDNALKFGADEVFYPQQVPEKYIVTEWEHIGRGVNIAVEASGSPKGLEMAGNITGVHGILSIVGWHQNGPRTINMELWNWKGITVINAHERRNEVHVACMKEALTMIEAGRFNMKDMITNEFKLDEVDRAYDVLVNKPEGFIKGVVKI